MVVQAQVIPCSTVDARSVSDSWLSCIILSETAYAWCR